MNGLITALTKSAKRLGLSRTSSRYLMAELALIEAVRDGREPDVAFEIAQSVLYGVTDEISSQRAVQAA